VGANDRQSIKRLIKGVIERQFGVMLNPAVFPLRCQKFKADVGEYGDEEELCQQKEEIFHDNCHEDNREDVGHVYAEI
jgi:hypothetical protein